jgi:hypothetical protein
MSEQPINPPDSTQSNPNLKALLVKGLVGAVSLAGATAIPLMVQQFLSPTPETPAAVSPTPQQSMTAQPVPPPTSPVLVPVQSQEVTETSNDMKELEKLLRNEERRRARGDDDDDDDD